MMYGHTMLKRIVSFSWRATGLEHLVVESGVDFIPSEKMLFLRWHRWHRWHGHYFRRFWPGKHDSGNVRLIGAVYIDIVLYVYTNI